MSQFTLYGTLKKGKTKPDFSKSMKSDTAKALYETLLNKLGHQYMSDKIKGD